MNLGCLCLLSIDLIIALLNIHSVNCCCIIAGVTKLETISLFKNMPIWVSKSLTKKDLFFIALYKLFTEILTFGDNEIKKIGFLIFMINHFKKSDDLYDLDNIIVKVSEKRYF